MFPPPSLKTSDVHALAHIQICEHTCMTTFTAMCTHGPSCAYAHMHTRFIHTHACTRAWPSCCVCLHHPLAAGGWGCLIRELCQQLYSPLKASGVRSSGKNNLERRGVDIFHEETSVLTSASASVHLRNGMGTSGGPWGLQAPSLPAARRKWEG